MLSKTPNVAATVVLLVRTRLRRARQMHTWQALDPREVGDEAPAVVAAQAERVQRRICAGGVDVADRRARLDGVLLVVVHDHERARPVVSPNQVVPLRGAAGTS